MRALLPLVGQKIIWSGAQKFVQFLICPVRFIPSAYMYAWVSLCFFLYLCLSLYLAIFSIPGNLHFRGTIYILEELPCTPSLPCRLPQILKLLASTSDADCGGAQPSSMGRRFNLLRSVLVHITQTIPGMRNKRSVRTGPCGSALSLPVLLFSFYFLSFLLLFPCSW